MRIERHGDGPRVFLGLHGWSGDRRTFLPLLNPVPDDVSFYSVDLPGCGSSLAPAKWTVGSVADEIADAIRSLGKPVTLVGNCSGANFGLFAALRVPERIERIVTIDMFAFWPWYFRVFVNPAIGRYAYFSTFANPLGRWIANLSLRAKRQETTSLTQGFTRVDHDTTYRYLLMLRDVADIQQFAGLRMPINLTYGTKSFEAARVSAHLFQRLWPQAGITPLGGAGHLPILEATRELREVLFVRHAKDSPCPKPTIRYAG